MIIFILIIFSYKCESSERIIKVDNLDVKIQKSLNILKTDSLYIHYLGANYGFTESFFVKDSTYIPFVSLYMYKYFYSDYSNEKLFDMYKNYQLIYTYKSQYLNISKSLPEKQSKNKSLYIIDIGIIESNLISLLVSPNLNNEIKMNMIELYILFDDKNNIVKYYSKQYNVTSSTYNISD
ncbi:MAG: hypothetical protein KF896_06065 [Ignavibacteriae bacterium]|nr:hypothetical protein [Ignavibacteriota bacterium]